MTYNQWLSEYTLEIETKFKDAKWKLDLIYKIRLRGIDYDAGSPINDENGKFVVSQNRDGTFKYIFKDYQGHTIWTTPNFEPGKLKSQLIDTIIKLKEERNKYRDILNAISKYDNEMKTIWNNIKFLRIHQDNDLFSMTKLLKSLTKHAIGGNI